MFLKPALIGSIPLVLLLFTVIVRSEDEIKHDGYFDKFTMIKGDDILAISLRLNKTDALKFILDMEVENFKDLSKGYLIGLNVSMSETADGPYELMTQYPETPSPLCDFLENDYNDNVYEQVKEYSNMPLYEKCELAPSKFTLKDMPLDGSSLDEFMTKGYYQTYINILDMGGNVLVCYVLYSHIDEK